MDFNARLTMLRKERGLNQTEVAKYIGISRGRYSMYELGKRFPRRETLEKLADFFSVDIDFLIGRTETRNPIDCKEGLSAAEKVLISNYRTLNQADKDIIIYFIKNMHK